MMLEVRDIHTYYDQSHVLQGATLDVGENEVVALLGRNGMGKTTLVRSIIGFNAPRRGSIRYRGREIAGLEPHLISRMGVALVPQGRRVFASLSVAEHLSAFARLPEKKGWTPEKLLDLFPRLRERFRNSGNKLSGGEQQMLVIGPRAVDQRGPPDHGRALRRTFAYDGAESSRGSSVSCARAACRSCWSSRTCLRAVGRRPRLHHQQGSHRMQRASRRAAAKP